MTTTGLSGMSPQCLFQQASAEPDPGLCGSVSELRALLYFQKIETLKVWWHAAILFCLFYLFLTLHGCLWIHMM